MEFEEVINKLSNEGSRGRFMAESFLLKILLIHIEDQGKKLSIESSRSDPKFDAFAPDGFDELNSPVYIDVTPALNFKRTVFLAKQFVRYLEGAGDKAGLLIVSMKPISEDELNGIDKFTASLNTSIQVWGPKEVEDIAAKHSDAVSDLVENLFSLRLESAMKKEQANWKNDRNRIVDDIKGAYKSGQFSLFLGAGVSSSAGLPDWDTLLNSLFVSMLTSEIYDGKVVNENEISSIVKRLREVDGASALMSARYIRKGMSISGVTEQTKFINAVTDQLYNLRNQKYSIDSPLIKSIAAMCMPGRTGAKVKSVVTYNFDDLIERELSKRGIAHKSIFEEIDFPTPEELPLYHVHGYLPEERTQYLNLDRSTLVFSEEGYHKIYNDSYHWSNLVQLNSLKESTCVMIGLSMTDPNLRRLLEIASRSIEKPRHYVFLKRVGFEEFETDRSKKIVAAPKDIVKTFLDNHHSLNEGILEELGVNIVWYESYDDIPVIIDSITKNI